MSSLIEAAFERCANIIQEVDDLDEFIALGREILQNEPPALRIVAKGTGSSRPASRAKPKLEVVHSSSN